MPSILQIGAEVQVGEVNAGMDAVAAKVRTTAQQMGGSFQGAAAEVEQATARISGASVRAAEAALAHSRAQAEVRAALRAVKAAGEDNTAEMLRYASAQEQLVATTSATAAAQKALQESLGNGGPAQETAHQMTEARHAVRGLGEEIGVKAPRFVSNFITSLGGVAPAMAAAFSAVAIVGILDLVPELISKIAEVGESLGGLTGKMKEAYAAAVEANNQFILKNFETREQVLKVGEAGETGMRRIATETANAQQMLRAYGAEGARALRGLNELREKRAELQKETSGVQGVFELPVRPLVNKEIEEVDKQIQRQQGLIDEISKRIEGLRVQTTSILPAEGANEAEERERAQSLARVEAHQKTNSAILAAEEQYTRQQRALGLIGADEELRQLKDIATKKIELDRAYYDQRRALARREEAATGKAANVEAINADALAAETAYLAKISAFESQHDVERKQQDIAVAQARIAAAKGAADTLVQLDQTAAKEQYAAHQINAGEEAAALESAETKRYSAEQKALAARLALAQQEPEKNRALIVTLNQDIENAETAHQARLQEIRAEGTRKALDDERRHMDQRIAAVEQSANRELQATFRLDDQRLRNGQYTANAWAEAEIAALNRWHTRQISVLQQAEAEARQAFGAESVEYQRLKDRESQVEERYNQESQRIREQQLQGWRQWSNQVSQTLATGVNSWIQGQKTFGQAMAQTWNQMLMATITDIEQLGAKWVAEHLMMAAVKKLLGLESAASDEALLGTTIATNVAKSSSDAAAAAAATLAYYSTFAPEIAPAMAAAQYGVGMTFAGLASLDVGGPILTTGLAKVHAGEGVLTKPVMDMIRSVPENGGTGGRFQMTYAPQVSAIDSRGVKEVLDQHSAHIVSIMRREMRRSNLR